MDYDRIERAIEFLVESQASLTAKVDANTEAIARLAAEAEADRQVMRAVVDKMDNAITEMHQGVNALLLIAERLTNSVQVLGKAQQGTTQRIERLENRVQVVEDRLENS